MGTGRVLVHRHRCTANMATHTSNLNKHLHLLQDSLIKGPNDMKKSHKMLVFICLCILIQVIPLNIVVLSLNSA